MASIEIVSVFRTEKTDDDHNVLSHDVFPAVMFPDSEYHTQGNGKDAVRMHKHWLAFTKVYPHSKGLTDPKTVFIRASLRIDNVEAYLDTENEWKACDEIERDARRRLAYFKLHRRAMSRSEQIEMEEPAQSQWNDPFFTSATVWTISGVPTPPAPVPANAWMNEL